MILLNKKYRTYHNRVYNIPNSNPDLSKMSDTVIKNRKNGFSSFTVATSTALRKLKLSNHSPREYQSPVDSLSYFYV